MPEFKKKTALGLRDLPENGQECTHVLLTHSEYDGLLAKVACAERDARSVYTAASQKIAQAERNSAQAKEAAYAEVDAVQKDLEEACRKIEYLDGLNKNLLRIARERANADRKLRPKKTHTGYAGPEGNVLAAQIPVVDVACGHFHRPGLAHVDRGGIQLVVNGRLSGKSADSHHTGHGQGSGHSGQFFQKRSLFHNTFSFCSR